MISRKYRKNIAVIAACMLMMSLGTAGCGTSASAAAETEDQTQASTTYLTAEDISVKETVENSTDEEHAITADGGNASYSNLAVVKTGEASGDEADFYGANAAIFATNGATLDLSEITVTTDGTHANAVFSYGEGTTVNISDSVIEASGRRAAPAETGASRRRSPEEE